MGLEAHNFKVKYQISVCDEIYFPWFDHYDYIGVPVRATNRPGSQLLGANGRDDGPIVSLLSYTVMNCTTI